MTTNLTARLVRETGDFLLLANGFQFGRLANCEVCHVFLSDDEELSECVDASLEGGMSIREVLAVVRRVYVALEARRDAEQAAEIWAENAWLRHAERYDDEAQADLALHDALHPYGYAA